jgi:hypothetical protein
MNFKTNMRMQFASSFECMVNQNLIKFQKGNKLIANILKTHDNCFDLEFVKSENNLIKNGDIIKDIPLSVLQIHSQDVHRVLNQITESN